MSDSLVRLNHAELLLLDLVEEDGAWVKGVADGDSWGTANKRGCDAYGVQIWADAFENLLGMGLVEFREQREDLGLGKELRPTRAEIVQEFTRTDISFDAMDERKPVTPIWVYRLTPLGGAVWEQFARANWTRYLDIDWGSLSEDNFEAPICMVKCADRFWIERFMAIADRVGMTIAFDTVKWREEKDWQVRRWKILPVVHVAEFKVNEGAELDLRELSWSEHQLFHGWKSRF